MHRSPSSGKTRLSLYVHARQETATRPCREEEVQQVSSPPHASPRDKELTRLLRFFHQTRLNWRVFYAVCPLIENLFVSNRSVQESTILLMDKAQFFQCLLSTLRQEVHNAVNAAKDAAEYATNEESRAQSQWDTQGLEASYLAAGQASQARQWANAIENLQSEREDLLKPNSYVSLGALFSCNFGDCVEYFFFAGTAGGQSILLNGQEVTVITAQSPLAGRLMGLKAGDSFSMPNGSSGQILTIE